MLGRAACGLPFLEVSMGTGSPSGLWFWWARALRGASAFGVVAGAPPVHDYYWLVTDDPGIVA
jgi:hypothetical protein